MYQLPSHPLHRLYPFHRLTYFCHYGISTCHSHIIQMKVNSGKFILLLLEFGRRNFAMFCAISFLSMRYPYFSYMKAIIIFYIKRAIYLFPILFYCCWSTLKHKWFAFKYSAKSRLGFGNTISPRHKSLSFSYSGFVGKEVGKI